MFDFSHELSTDNSHEMTVLIFSEKKKKKKKKKKSILEISSATPHHSQGFYLHFAPVYISVGFYVFHGEKGNRAGN